MRKRIKVPAALISVLVIVGCQTSLVKDSSVSSQWGSQKNGLRTQIREIPNNFARGYLKLISLSMENVGRTPVQYDDQQVDCNDSLIVKRNGIETVPFRGELVSTLGESKTIDPGCVVPLFYGLILEEQYDISEPGLYTVQFRGLQGFEDNAPIPESNVITIRMKQ